MAYPKNYITKHIDYAFPASNNAKALGYERTGCWHISLTIHNIEGSGFANTYLPPDAEGFTEPDDADLIELFLEERGVICPHFRTYGNSKALAALYGQPYQLPHIKLKGLSK